MLDKKLIVLLITSLILTNAANANFGLLEQSDYTGETFFTSAEEPVKIKNEDDNNVTIPPIKLLRLKLKARKLQKEQQELELAPTQPKDNYVGEIETSEYASKDLEDDFDEVKNEDFESVDSEVEKNEKSRKIFKKKKNKSTSSDTENIVLDCDEINYDTQNYLIYATGNVNVNFVKQDIDVKADVITFDRINNTIKAEGNVCILKNGQTIIGDYIFVDMNEENALIENPISETGNIQIKSKKRICV